MRSTSGAFDTFYESLSLLMSPTRKSACDLLNLLSPRRSCSGVWGSSATSSVLTPMRIIHVPSMLASMTRRRSGNDLVVALVKHGYAPSRMTSHQNLGLWSARHRAYDRDQWRDIVETATLLQGHATRWWWWWLIPKPVPLTRLIG